MNDLKTNRSFRVIVGGFVLYVAFRLWKDGWLEWAFSDQPDEGYGNADLMLAIGSMLINFLELVGIAAIAIVSGVIPELSKIIDWASEQVRALSERYKAGRDKDDPAFDWRPLIVVLLLWILFSSGKVSVIVDKIKQIIGIEDVVPQDLSSAIIFLDEDATSDQLMIANSSKIADMMDQAGVERRLYYDGQDLGDAESWVVDYVQAADPQSSSLIMSDSSGRVSIRSLPTDLEDYEKLFAQ